MCACGYSSAQQRLRIQMVVIVGPWQPTSGCRCGRSVEQGGSLMLRRCTTGPVNHVNQPQCDDHSQGTSRPRDRCLVVNIESARLQARKPVSEAHVRTTGRSASIWVSSPWRSVKDTSVRAHAGVKRIRNPIKEVRNPEADTYMQANRVGHCGKQSGQSRTRRVNMLLVVYRLPQKWSCAR